ncbi:hypothetical protein [Streptomyces sp. NPDC002540]
MGERIRDHKQDSRQEPRNGPGPWALIRACCASHKSALNARGHRNAADHVAAAILHSIGVD